jgi:DNA-binding NarL/FixJ family response regulator
VLGEAETGRQAVEMTKKLRPNVVVMDIAMPLLNGLQATRQVLKAAPESKVLMLSAHSDDAYVQDAINAGAMGFLLKQTSAHVLAEAIRELQKGKLFFSPSVAKRIRRRNEKAPIETLLHKRKLARLSAREMEVLQLIAEGKANKETAHELGIGMKTVEKHREHIMDKLDIHGTAGLTRYAISMASSRTPFS